MPIGFPPAPRYPLGIDDDFTLYLVFNTAETPLSSDNAGWSDEILIVPQAAGKAELWGDNGFVNLDGELIYYDAVAKDSNGKIYKLKRCARNLGGKPPKFNKKGTVIRGYVIAEHHNQLVNTAIRIEDFIGENLSDDPITIDYRVRELEDVPNCTDDFCPDVTFDFEVINEDNCEGTTIAYTIEIVGSFDTFLLEFGDGSSTASTIDGTHLYPPGAKIDPVVRVENDDCTIIQTGVIRTEDDQLQLPEPSSPLTIPIPVIPEIPDLNIPDITVPGPEIAIPPVIFPCIDLTPLNFPGISIGPIDIQVPSVIEITPPIPSVIVVLDNIPAFISVIPPTLTPISVIPPMLTPISIIGTFPSVISVVDTIPSVISLVGNVPSTISLVGTIPSTITIVGTVPSTISVIDSIPDVISVVGDIPAVISGTVSVDWGTPPTLSVSIVCPSSCGGSPTPIAGPLGFLNEDFDNDSLGSIDIDYDFVGIPSVIKVEAPEMPDIRINTSNMPSEIMLSIPNDFPREITVRGLDALPKHIDIMMPETLPSIGLDVSNLPKSIDISISNMIHEISLVTSPDFPSVIKIDGSNIPNEIQVVGIPSFIELRYPDKGIQLLMPEKAEIEMVYKGAPIEVVLKMDDRLLSEGGGDYPCFALVPCNPK